jgi:hypothetical protein
MAAFSTEHASFLVNLVRRGRAGRDEGRRLRRVPGSSTVQDLLKEAPTSGERMMVPLLVSPIVASPLIARFLHHGSHPTP